MTQVSVLEIRKGAGLTQKELAELSGVAQPNIAAYERGVRRPSPRMLARLISAASPKPSTVLSRHKVAVAEIARKYHAVDVKVFGSIARGEDRPGSDVDLLVTFAPEASLYDQVELAQEIEELLGVRVDVVSAGGLRERHDSIRREARSL